MDLPEGKDDGFALSCHLIQLEGPLTCRKQGKQGCFELGQGEGGQLSPTSSLAIVGWELGLSLKPKAGLWPFNQLLYVGGVQHRVLWVPKLQDLGREALLRQPLHYFPGGGVVWDPFP